MEKVRYERDSEKYLLTLENLNIDEKMSGVAWRNMIEIRLPLEARRRWVHKKFSLDSEFVEAVRRCSKAEISFKEQLGLERTHDNPREKGWGRGERNKNITFKKNKIKPAWNKTRKNYTPEEKKLYAEKRNQATKGNNQGKVEPTDWNAAHKDINPETRQQRGRAGQCTRCGMTNHTWRQCRRCYGGSNILRTSEYTRPVRLSVWGIRLGRRDSKSKDKR